MTFSLMQMHTYCKVYELKWSSLIMPSCFIFQFFWHIKHSLPETLNLLYFVLIDTLINHKHGVGVITYIKNAFPKHKLKLLSVKLNKKSQS